MEAPPDISQSGFRIGTSGYYYDDWVGRFNPPIVRGKRLTSLSDEERKDQDRLQFYQKYFRFVEINNTFYREPMLSSFLDMEKRSHPDTQYTVKVHRDISHTRSWNKEKSAAMMRDHITAVSPLIETGRFYSFLIQLEDHLCRSQERLDYLLTVSSEAVKKKIDVHIEFRHNSWHNRHVLQSLKDSGVGICNTEIPPVPHAFPLKAYATTDKGYVRYSGRNTAHWVPTKKAGTAKERLEQRNNRYNYLYSKEELTERVKGQITLSRKTGEVAVAYNNHFQTKAILNAIQNINLIKMKLGIEL